MKNLIVLFFSFWVTTVLAQYDYDVNKSKSPIGEHYLGLHLGASTGRGISYQYSKQESWGVQFVYFPPNANGDHFPGISFKYELSRTERFHYFFGKRLTSIYLYQGNVLEIRPSPTDNRMKVNNSIGIGAGFFLGDHFLLGSQLGFGGFDEFETLNYTIEFGCYFLF